MSFSKGSSEHCNEMCTQDGEGVRLFTKTRVTSFINEVTRVLVKLTPMLLCRQNNIVLRNVSTVKTANPVNLIEIVFQNVFHLSCNSAEEWLIKDYAWRKTVFSQMWLQSIFFRVPPFVTHSRSGVNPHRRRVTSFMDNPFIVIIAFRQKLTVV